ncbi:hypothetical protein A4H97_17555 [Niastella yeongjuensis]|uniref:Uncharacterized protein n=1 Tax=Niastella yeongjuensis TaxID=354355 RepID=A0A1V9E1L7_9BACT|nr:hypothetical protein [Niastella yeongjuensis]OQP40023.1 hypothetical protein A4H97_17555 [Niastella yeongjuensis]SEO13916.1 hypothetical protein SAMN05660816_02256 [Niastella yeongjuensis]
MKLYFLVMVSMLFNYEDVGLQKNKTEVVIYATPLFDFRNFPMSKELLKISYEFCTRLSGEEYVNDFLQMAGTYDSTAACEKCNQPLDTRIYVQVYDKGKLKTEMEIGVGGGCIKISNKPYCVIKATLDYLISYFPAKFRDKYTTVYN